MGNMCCRRVGYSPNGAEVDNGRCQQQQASEQQQPKSPVMSNAYHSAGDDCAINELLEGRMDLDVVLPDGRKVRLTVERRTPMMDLLVQAASATKISPAGHTIHVYGDDGKGSSTLHYKPSTPIGSLDANTICIVPKKDVLDSSARRAPKMANRPFEPTFRVQVHLPRNQLTVVRVSPRVKISELRTMVCQEKGLDTSRYQLVRPSVRGQPLPGDLTLAEYGSTEITLLSNSCIESHICNSTSHIMPYSKRIEEQKRKTGILRLLAEDANQKVQRKATLQRPAPTIKITEAPHPGRYKPKKRRPAPPPPPPTLPEPPFHSRQSSSDSSGYHEATSSFLHEEHCVEDKASSDSSGVSSLDAKVATVQNTKKRKAPPPPPPPGGVERKEEEAGGQVTRDVEPRPPVVEVLEYKAKEKPEEPVVQVPVPVIETENTEAHNIKDSTERDSSKEGEVVTRVALVALNARIEQDVTQQEIASSIQAAFHSVDTPQRTTGPSLLAIKQRGGQTTESEDAPTSASSKPLSSSAAPTGKQPLESAAFASEGRSSDPSTGSSEHSAGVSSTPAKRQPVDRRSSVPTTELNKLSVEVSSTPATRPPTEQPVDRRSVPTTEVKKHSARVSSTPATRQPTEQPVDRPSVPTTEDKKHSAGVSSTPATRQPTEQPVDRRSSVPTTGISKHSAGVTSAPAISHPTEKSSGGKSSVPTTGISKHSAGVSSAPATSYPTEKSSGGRSVPTTGISKHSSTVSTTHTTRQPTKQSLDRQPSGGRSSIRAVEELPTTGYTKHSGLSSTSTTEQSVKLVTEQPSGGETFTSGGKSIRVTEVPPPSGFGKGSTGLSSYQTTRPSTLTTEQPLGAGGRSSIPELPSTTSGDGLSDFNAYPLQKSSARLNFEPKDDSDDGLQAFPPPPSEFRGVENEALLIDDEPPIPCPPTFRSSPSKTLRRSSSLLNLTETAPQRVAASKSKKVRHLQRSLSDLTVDDKGEFEAEQERLQREYLKLQRQFILWQQQLLSNHAMLREECIVPQYARTLRQSHSLPEGQDYTDESPGPCCPLVSRSLSYEPTKCSTLPRSAINIPPLEFGSVPISNGSSTLRSSKTKSYFKPPQVRVSTKNRQRLPPEIRKDGELDIYDDARILSTILPTFDSLKLISEGNDDDRDVGSLILKLDKKSGNQPDAAKKVPPPVPNKLATLPKPDMNRQNNERNRNGDSGRVCDTVKEAVQSNGSQPPPPPPLPEKAKNSNVVKPSNVSGPRTVVDKKVIAPQVDTREQLMQEIRRCGGRTALRKISLDIAS